MKKLAFLTLLTILSCATYQTISHPSVYKIEKTPSIPLTNDYQVYTTTRFWQALTQNKYHCRFPYVSRRKQVFAGHFSEEVYRFVYINGTKIEAPASKRKKIAITMLIEYTTNSVLFTFAEYPPLSEDDWLSLKNTFEEMATSFTYFLNVGHTNWIEKYLSITNGSFNTSFSDDIEPLFSDFEED